MSNISKVCGREDLKIEFMENAPELEVMVLRPGFEPGSPAFFHLAAQWRKAGILGRAILPELQGVMNSLFLSNKFIPSFGVFNLLDFRTIFYILVS